MSALVSRQARSHTAFRLSRTAGAVSLAIASTLAAGLLAVCSASATAAPRSTDDPHILADVGWNSMTPQSTQSTPSAL